MNNITNTIEIEYEGFTVEVNYSWRKGHAGNWFHPPEEDTIEINKIETLSLINEDCELIEFDKDNLANIPYDILEEQIKIDIDSYL
tara:strand:+ start:316 stop:573 length:258 start_codon:yes stop_codon:yes gene_type:complete